jgi:hypothetical protein
MLDDDDYCEAISGMNDCRGKPQYSKKCCSSSASCTANPTSLELDSNQDRRCGNPVTNRLSYSTANWYHATWLGTSKDFDPIWGAQIQCNLTTYNFRQKLLRGSWDVQGCGFENKAAWDVMHLVGWYLPPSCESLVPVYQTTQRLSPEFINQRNIRLPSFEMV